MPYTKVTVSITPYSTDASDVLIAMFGEIGFESFQETESGFEGYIPTPLYRPQNINQIDMPFNGIGFTWIAEDVADQNWNEVWEKNYFNPIVIDNKCVVRGPFHPHYPHIPYQILIAPKMAFGTGHHETTGMILRYILESDMTGKKVLDMGCGTGILGILASMLGASEVTGIDIDEWSYHNAKENCELNHIHNMKISIGDASSLEKMEPFDIVFANINRNILLNDIKHYSKVLKPGGLIFLSGFYHSDLDLISQEAIQQNLQFESCKEQNEWIAAMFRKSTHI